MWGVGRAHKVMFFLTVHIVMLGLLLNERKDRKAGDILYCRLHSHHWAPSSGRGQRSPTMQGVEGPTKSCFSLQFT